MMWLELHQSQCGKELHSRTTHHEQFVDDSNDQVLLWHLKVILKVISNVTLQQRVAQHSFVSCKVNSGKVFNSTSEVKHEGWV